MPWQSVPGFGNLSGYEPFRCADELVAHLGARACRFRHAGAGWALLMPFNEFCSLSEPRITCRFGPGFDEVLETDDRLLVISGSEVRAAVDELLAHLQRTSSDAPPQWLAAPGGSPSASTVTPNAPEAVAASRLILACPDGAPHEFTLEPIGTAAAARRLRLARPTPRLPEGPDNLSRREGWFRAKSGWPNRPVSGS